MPILDVPLSAMSACYNHADYRIVPEAMLAHVFLENHECHVMRISFIACYEVAKDKKCVHDNCSIVLSVAFALLPVVIATCCHSTYNLLF